MRIKRPRAFAHDDDGVGQLVERDGADRGDFREARPDIGEHDDDQRRQIEQRDQPGIEQPVGELVATHDIADRRPETHGEREGGDNPRQRDREIGEEGAGDRLFINLLENGRRSRKAARIG